MVRGQGRDARRRCGVAVATAHGLRRRRRLHGHRGSLLAADKATDDSDDQPDVPLPRSTPIPTRTALYLAGDESAGVQGAAGQAQATPVVRAQHHRRLRRDHGRVGRRIPGKARVPRDWRGRSGDLGQAGQHDPASQPTTRCTTGLSPGRRSSASGDSGDRVRELQARLKQIGWFSADVTGNYGGHDDDGSSPVSRPSAGFRPPATSTNAPGTGWSR